MGPDADYRLEQGGLDGHSPPASATASARLIGAEPGTVVLGDTLSIKVYQALASALDLAAPGSPGGAVATAATSRPIFTWPKG